MKPWTTLPPQRYGRISLAATSLLLLATSGATCASSAPFSAAQSTQTASPEQAATPRAVPASLIAGDTPGDSASAMQSPSIYHLYVATSGNDNNPGSRSAPFRTIGKAASMAQPSTTIHFAPGDYTGNVVTRASGTVNGRIRFVSDSKWDARIFGTGNGAHWSNHGNFVDVAGFDVSGPGRLGIVNFGSNTLIEGNHVHDLKVSGGCGGLGGAGILNAEYRAADADIIGNVVHDIGVPGRCNGVQGIYHSNLRGKVVNNIVYRASAWGIHLWHAANNVVVANNTVFGNGSATMGGGISTGAGDQPGGIVLNNTRVINNIVYNNPRASIAQFCYGGTGCIGATNITANNLVYGNGRGISLRVGIASGTITADPEFVDFRSDGRGNYRLQRGSPAVDRALGSGGLTYDIDNQPRPQGGAADIGAYESF